MPRRAQGAFEYILLLVGILLVVVVVVGMLRFGVLSGVNASLQAGLQQYFSQLGFSVTPTPGAASFSFSSGGSTATVGFPSSVTPGDTVVFVSSPSCLPGVGVCMFNGSTDQPTNMTFSTDNESAVLNFTAKYGASVNTSESHSWNATKQNGTTIVATSSILSPSPSPSPSPQIWIQTTKADFENSTLFQTNASLQDGSVILNISPNLTWIQVRPTPNPSNRKYHKMAFDSARNITVLFGGICSSYCSDTWLFNGTAWNQSPATGPSNRDQYGMAFDSARNVTVLYGGEPAKTDTWLFNGTTWTNVTTAIPPYMPPQRYWSAMAFDSARNVTVLFGGYNPINDTWLFNGTHWNQAFPSSAPGARYVHSMAFDSARNVTVLFGGLAAPNQRLGDTWLFNGTTWTNVTTAVPPYAPSARYEHSMAFDSARNVTVLFGGTDGTWKSDTWLFNGTHWNLVPTDTSGGPGGGHAMAFDSVRNMTVLFGGYVNGRTNQTGLFGIFYFSLGNLTSQIFDAGQNATWLNIAWIQSLPTDTNLTMQTSTSTDNVTWSEWSTPYYCVDEQCNFPIISPDGTRYIKWLANLTTTFATKTPILQEVNVTYAIP